MSMPSFNTVLDALKTPETPPAIVPAEPNPTLEHVQSLDRVLRRILSSPDNDFHAVYAGEHLAVPCGLLGPEKAAELILANMFPALRVFERIPHPCWHGTSREFPGRFEMRVGADLTLTLAEARNALETRTAANDAVRAWQNTYPGLVQEVQGVLRQHVWLPAPDAKHAQPSFYRCSLLMRITFIGGATVSRALAVPA